MFEITFSSQTFLIVTYNVNWCNCLLVWYVTTQFGKDVTFIPLWYNVSLILNDCKFEILYLHYCVLYSGHEGRSHSRHSQTRNEENTEFERSPNSERDH